MNYVVIKIHNNKISRIINAKDEENGLDILRRLVSNQLGRALTSEEINHIDTYQDFDNEEMNDHDNVYYLSIEVVEN